MSRGFSVIFPKILDAIYVLYESGNFSDSFRNHIFESENFRFLFFFSKKQHNTRGVKCEKLSVRKS